MEDWMSRRPDRLTLSQLTIPGSHDAGMYKSCDHSGKQIPGTVSVVAANTILCHSQNIFEQLRLGMRMFDVRVTKTKSGKLHTFHFAGPLGGFGASLEEILDQVDAFLDDGAGAGETVILKFSHTKPDSIRTKIMSMVYTKLGDKLYATTDNTTIGLVPLQNLRGKVIAVYEPGFVGYGAFRRSVIPYLNPKKEQAWTALSAGAKDAKLVYRGFYANRRTYKDVLKKQEANLKAWAKVRGGRRYDGELMQLYWTSTFNLGRVLKRGFHANIEKNTAPLWVEGACDKLLDLIIKYSPNIVIIDFADADKVDLIVKPPGGRQAPARPSRAGRPQIKKIGQLQGEDLYRRVMMEKVRGDWNTVGGHPRAQFERDIALWHGAITRPSARGYAWKGEMLEKLFLILHYGGLMVNRGAPGEDGWVPWCETDDPIPICAAISHTARILISLPEGNAADKCWRWLWGRQRPKARMMATHGMSAAPRQTIYPGVDKDVRETKGGKAGIQLPHYGVNIALGGAGNKNPVSQKRIRDDGMHGHLYLAYGKNVLRSHSRRSVLIGTEQSAPYDRSAVNLAHIKGIPDQYGGRHALGGHNRYSATGGDDFSYASLDRQTGEWSLRRPTELGDYGPSLSHYIDGMFIDLTAERFLRIVGSEFEPSMIADCGRPPLPPKR